MTEQAEIIALEHAFWQAMADVRIEDAAAMMTPEAASVSAMGANHFTPTDWTRRSRDGGWRVERYTLSEEQVSFPSETTAVITYVAEMTVSGPGETLEGRYWGASVWLRGEDGRWLCAFNSESPVQD